MRDKNIKKRVMTFIVISLILFSHLSVLGENETTNDTGGKTNSETMTDGLTNGQTTVSDINNISTVDSVSKDKNISDIQTENIDTSTKINDTIKEVIKNNNFTGNISSEIIYSTNVSEGDDLFQNELMDSTENVSLVDSSVSDSNQTNITSDTNATDVTIDSNDSTNIAGNNIPLSSETTNGDSGGGGGDYNYVQIENVSSENNTDLLPQSQTNENDSQKKMYTTCTNEGEGYAGNLTGCNIGLTVTKENEFEKEIIINSSVHINEPIRIFTKINKISINDTASVKIYWINNNNLEVTDKTFYNSNDTDKEDYDQVSWTVPHLSEQIFRLIINYTKVEDNTTDGLNLKVISPVDNQVIENPVQFDYNVSYKNLSNIICTLAIDGSSSLDTINMVTDNMSLIWPQNLANGEHDWILICKDKGDNTIENSSAGTFIINETFSVDLNQKIYLIGEDVSLKIYSKNNTRLDLINPDNIGIFNIILQEPYPRDYIIGSSNFTRAGMFNINITSLDYLARPYSWLSTINVAKMNLTQNKQNLSINESIDYTINIDSPIPSFCYTLYFGDNNQTNECPQSNIFQKTISYKYQSIGSYSPRLDVMINNRTFTQVKSAISVINLYDTEKPGITLLSPDDDVYIRNSSVIFSYRPTDNIRLNNCTFSLYYANGSSWGYSYGESDLVTRSINSSLKNNEITMITLNNLPEKNYFWEISCYDNSTNNQKTERFFTINLTNGSSIQSASTSSSQSNTNSNDSGNYSYEQKSDVTAALTSLNDFIKKEESYSLDQKEILDDLGISKELDYYNKRLNQIDQDLGYNLKYIETSDLREKRRLELIDEYKNISNQVPKDIQVLQESEYVKNSLSLDLETFLKEYLNMQGISPSKSELKKIDEEIFKIQNSLEISIKLRQVKIDYKDRSRQITVVSKSIKIKNDSIEEILEIIPKEIRDKNKVEFITPAEQVNDSGIFLLNIKEIVGNKIVYSIDGLVDLKQLEKTDTLLYKEFVINSVVMTGFSILDFQISDWSYIIAFLIFGLVIIYLFLTLLKKGRVSRWKKEENVVKLFSLIKEGKKSIRKEDIETAKEKYHNIRTIYPLVPAGCKKYTLKDIKSIQECIDKKDINDLIKEYDAAKKEKRTDDANRIYEKIKDNYKKLPKKERAKVKDKLFK